jgi:hypothetical protein
MFYVFPTLESNRARLLAIDLRYGQQQTLRLEEMA